MVEIKSTQTEKILYKGKVKLPKSASAKKERNIQPTPPHPQLPMPKSEAPWYVYILQCKNNSLYTGVTSNLNKRMKIHKSGKGSKYVKAKGFKQLLKFKKCPSKSDAHKAEYQIKQLPTQLQKLDWFIQNR